VQLLDTPGGGVHPYEPGRLCVHGRLRRMALAKKGKRGPRPTGDGAALNFNGKEVVWVGSLRKTGGYIARSPEKKEPHA